MKIYGAVVLPQDTKLENATIFVILEKVGMLDKPNQVLAQEILSNVSSGGGETFLLCLRQMYLILNI